MEHGDFEHKYFNSILFILLFSTEFTLTMMYSDS